MEKASSYAFGAIVLVLLAIGLYAKISYDNQEVSLRNQITAEQENSENIFDNMWKIISGKAQIAAQYEGDFRKVYPALMEARYQGNGQGSPLMKFVVEHNPTFDTGLYKSLSNAIDAKRGEFQDQQTKLLDLKREHDNLRTLAPSSWFEGGKPEIKLTIVTSSDTQNTFKTGTEEDRPIFPKSQ